MTDQIKPKSRKNNLVVQELKNEILIYDLAADKAFCLNETSALIWQLCDGGNTATEISRRLSKQLKTPVSEDFVWLALDQLKHDNLLAADARIDNEFNGMSRREVIRKVGFASMIALPVISSLAAPTAAMAASGGVTPGSRTLGQSCTASVQCASSAPNCNSGTCCVGSGSSPRFTTSSRINRSGTCPASNSECNSFATTCCSGNAVVNDCRNEGPGFGSLTCSCT